MTYRPPPVSYYPLPYPASYPPAPLPQPPACQPWTPDRPHRYVVCRHCNTILITLINLPATVSVTRHFSDDVPAALSQTFVTPHRRNRIHQADALMWIRRSFSGLYSYRPKKSDTSYSDIPLACRACQQPVAKLLLLFTVADDFDAGSTSTPSKLRAIMDARVPHSHAKLSFLSAAVSLSDAYGRHISAAAEARGFWSVTPAPYAGRPMPQV